MARTIADIEASFYLIYGWYTLYQGRPGDTAGVDGWVDWMSQFNATREQMQLQLLGSSEYDRTATERLGI